MSAPTGQIARPREVDPLLEALVELARSAIATRAQADAQRRTIRAVKDDKAA